MTRQDAPHIIAQLFAVLIPPFYRLQTACCRFFVAASQLHVTHDESKRVNVVAHVGTCRHQLFRSHVALCASRLFQYGMSISVGQSEVYYLYVMPIARHLDILWLQVAVGDT